MLTPFVDLHNHPAMKPYGQSFSRTPGQNTLNRRKKNSIWFYDSPNFFERALQMLTGISKFTQSDCTTLVYGNARIVCASLYPIERGFFTGDIGTGVVSELLNAFVTGVGERRVDFIQNIKDYYEDLLREYDFYKQLDKKSVTTEVGNCKYVLVRNYAEIENHVANNPNDTQTIFVIMTIEGMHVLNSDYDERGIANEASILANLANMKQWDHPPFFVTFAHHFYNHLCGHAHSLAGLVGNKTDQSFGLSDPFTELGRKVTRELLSNQNGKRIYIDIKHMSTRTREEYYQMLMTEFVAEEIPIIISHGAANGLRSRLEPVIDSPATSPKLLAEDINFYDNELLLVARSRGIIGLQLDERRVASISTLKNTKHAIPMNKIRHYRAELLWNQVQHIAELLDRNGLFAWGCIGIGSDYDGVVNPLNGFLTAETFPFLLEYLERYAHNYLQGPGGAALKPYNQISASEIVNRIFSTNSMEFMQRWFK